MDIDTITQAREVCADIPEHEILLRFVNDDDAVAFSRWWNDAGGEKAFRLWAQEIEDPHVYS